jgi:glycyl-tRNA synthetase beta chain
MQPRAEADLARMMTEALTLGGLKVGASKTYSGPRRIVFIAEDVPAQSAATAEERKGPRVGAPQKAVEGFLRAAGLKSLDQCQIVKDPKGDYYLARSEKPKPGSLLLKTTGCWLRMRGSSSGPWSFQARSTRASSMCLKKS